MARAGESGPMGTEGDQRRGQQQRQQEQKMVIPFRDVPHTEAEHAREAAKIA